MELPGSCRTKKSAVGISNSQQFDRAHKTSLLALAKQIRICAAANYRKPASSPILPAALKPPMEFPASHALHDDGAIKLPWVAGSLAREDDMATMFISSDYAS